MIASLEKIIQKYAKKVKKPKKDEENDKKTEKKNEKMNSPAKKKTKKHKVIKRRGKKKEARTGIETRGGGTLKSKVMSMWKPES